MAIKIITLIENSPGEHRALKAEHGIAFLIVKDNLRILFDTGQSGAFIENARQLRVDLTARALRPRALRPESRKAISLIWV